MVPPSFKYSIECIGHVPTRNIEMCSTKVIAVVEILDGAVIIFTLR